MTDCYYNIATEEVMSAFTTHNQADIEIQSTFKVGSIMATREELERAFGKPLLNSALHVTAEWRVAFADFDETIATIYDYKAANIQSDKLPWEIGGKSRKAVELVHEQFRLALGLAKHREEIAL